MNPINSIRSSNVKTLGKSWKVVEENREPAESVNRKECKSENDIRTVDCWGQSIDLALSVRGREALRAVGLEEVVVDHHGIAMRGRMIHNKNGSLKEILYDGVNQNCIYSVTRRYLNIVLLNAAEKYSEVSLHFNKKVVDADLDDGKLTILDTRTRKIEKAKADLIIGADGAYSIIRRTMAKKPRFNCSQTYIEHGYLELFVPSGKNNECKPYHVGKTTLLLGDAAHAMVPFYAQGMNTGFEDVLLLDELMERYNSDFSKVLPKFSELRCEDAHAICDLAMYNYVEMRDLVRKKSFLVRKYIDTFLYKRIPKTWIPLYSTIHFSRMRFRDCIANKQWQDKVGRNTMKKINNRIRIIQNVLEQLSFYRYYAEPLGARYS
ncbi:kynurenine 3-monooxygenase isoform X8 [Apis mellifera]|uniref:Kynurenine 3-monooxygenase isoform X8 n=1 Tax=Apis mellifera TaxID=7460 RepID=A0A7M7L8T7_APIME|nr:kynurenine 3-monooxygenase isoform X8 [Apis mellifera]|eukprot:XP_026296051.1 kynurenine 3-monooxygenase isoform X8 [Apis mellifera]